MSDAEQLCSFFEQLKSTPGWKIKDRAAAHAVLEELAKFAKGRLAAGESQHVYWADLRSEG
jgi:hypothetical protein